MQTTSSQPTILLSGEIGPNLIEDIRAISPGSEVAHFASLKALGERIVEAEIIATTELPPEMLAKAERLRWVQSWAAGPDVLMYPEMQESSVVLTSCKGNGAIPLAEHAMMLMLMLDRDVPRSLAAQSAKRWDRFYHGELNRRTCGILGMGHSGQDLAAKAKAFHMRVIGMRRTAREAPNFDRVYSRSELPEFLGECDFLVITAPLTSETQGMLGEAEFKAMKSGLFYVCFSRGGIAEDSVLLKALQEKWIAGAGLDAHAIEPLPSDSPFWELPNVIITPHHGALTPATRQRGYSIFLDNLRRYLNGQPLHNIVDKRAGY